MRSTCIAGGVSARFVGLFEAWRTVRRGCHEGLAHFTQPFFQASQMSLIFTALWITAPTIAKRITDRIDESFKPEVAKQAAYYDHRAKLCNKPIHHFEAFVAKVMFVQVR